jgi:hypothetical protein
MRNRAGEDLRRWPRARAAGLHVIIFTGGCSISPSCSCASGQQSSEDPVLSLATHRGRLPSEALAAAREAESSVIGLDRSTCSS